MRRELRLLDHERAVDVDDAEPRVGDERDNLREQRHRVGVAPALVGVGKVLTDIAEPRRAEQRVGDGVREDVRVGVARETELVLDLDPSEDETTARGEAMRVVADARERHGAARSLSPAPIDSRRRSRRSNTDSSCTPASASAASARS